MYYIVTIRSNIKCSANTIFLIRTSQCQFTALFKDRSITANTDILKINRYFLIHTIIQNRLYRISQILYARPIAFQTSSTDLKRSICCLADRIYSSRNRLHIHRTLSHFPLRLRDLFPI